MNKILINILLFSTLVIGSIGLITFDVWADTQYTGVYEIPDDYNGDNMYIEFYRDLGASNNVWTFETYEYDFDVYVPDGYNYVFVYYKSCPYSWYVINPAILIYSDTQYGYYCFSTELAYDDNYVARFQFATTNMKRFDGEESEPITIYLKNNASSYHKIGRKLVKDDVVTSTYNESYISLSSLERKQVYYDSKTYYSVMFNQPVVYYGSGYLSPTANTSSYVFTTSELQKSIFPGSEPEYVINTDKLTDLIPCINKIKSKETITVYPEPKLKSAKFNSANNVIRLIYERDNDCLPNLVEMYDKIFVKIQGEEEWRTLDNLYDDKKIVSVMNDSKYKLIAGAVNGDKLLNKLGYDYSDDDSTKPIIEAVIWGMRYGYRLKSANYKYTSYVFSRYVFEDNVITDTDITIDDLGNLSDIKPGTSGDNGVSVKPGGTENNPIIGGTDEADYSDLGSFLKSFNFDFSSIGNAISGSFSLVTGFASMIGNIFQNFFGDGVGIIALLAIGICVVLRVLGR